MVQVKIFQTRGVSMPSGGIVEKEETEKEMNDWLADIQKDNDLTIVYFVQSSAGTQYNARDTMTLFYELHPKTS